MAVVGVLDGDERCHVAARAAQGHGDLLERERHLDAPVPRHLGRRRHLRPRRQLAPQRRERVARLVLVEERARACAHDTRRADVAGEVARGERDEELVAEGHRQRGAEVAGDREGDAGVEQLAEVLDIAAAGARCDADPRVARELRAEVDEHLVRLPEGLAALSGLRQHEDVHARIGLTEHGRRVVDLVARGEALLRDALAIGAGVGVGGLEVDEVRRVRVERRHRVEVGAAALEGQPGAGVVEELEGEHRRVGAEAADVAAEADLDVARHAERVRRRAQHLHEAHVRRDGHVRHRRGRGARVEPRAVGGRRHRLPEGGGAGEGGEDEQAAQHGVPRGRKGAARTTHIVCQRAGTEARGPGRRRSSKMRDRCEVERAPIRPDVW